MMVKCPVCGSHAPEETAVEIPLEGGVRRYCSLRCAEAEAASEGAPRPLPALPALPRRLLVAVDGSGPSLRAAELAVALAAREDGEVILLHAIDPQLLRMLPMELAEPARTSGRLAPEDLEEGLRRDAAAQLERCRRICEKAGVAVSTRIELQAPAHAIADAAELADLVVMGSRGLGAFSGEALGSLSRRVLGATRKPVLVVH
jgi:nucleotide-binding universal stress UspA family protein